MILIIDKDVFDSGWYLLKKKKNDVFDYMCMYVCNQKHLYFLCKKKHEIVTFMH